MQSASSATPGLLGVRNADLKASLIVFLVALPLCMGIAIASKMPPAAGIVSGVIGGLIVGSFAGCPLQVTGPAAGVAVMVGEIVDGFGLPGLGMVVFLAGLMQIAAGQARIGRWFQAVSPSVIEGMLAGIGVLIMAGQFHVCLDRVPEASALRNLLAMPGALLGVVQLQGPTAAAGAVALVTTLVLVGWPRTRLAQTLMLPGPLLGVALGTLLANTLALPIHYVHIPPDLRAVITPPHPGFLDPARTRSHLDLGRSPGLCR